MLRVNADQSMSLSDQKKSVSITMSHILPRLQLYIKPEFDVDLLAAPESCASMPLHMKGHLLGTYHSLQPPTEQF